TAHGISFVGLNALIMQRYMHEYKWNHEDFAVFSINAHANAVYNPNARFRYQISKNDFSNAVIVADPITILDASPIGDGAAAALLVPMELLKRQGIQPIIKVAASAAATDTIAIHSRKDPLWLSASEKSSRKAYSQAGVEPADIDVFETHDAFTIMAALSLEAAGFANRGQGPKLANDGEIFIDGRIPISTFGGLKARGHPVGATGMYQIVELVQQLRNEANDEIQIKDASIGMAQNIGGSGSSIITHILQKV
ncbi:MAG: thiolase domain-containing protein, partial [Anaerolineaceae bacterium]|nr:thiolase domain-containing protein [Anaerolineaceae bacterium]